MNNLRVLLLCNIEIKLQTIRGPDSVIFITHRTFILFHHKKGKEKGRGFYFSQLVLTVTFDFKSFLPSVCLLTIPALPNCLWSFQRKEIYLTSNKVDDYYIAMCHERSTQGMDKRRLQKESINAMKNESCDFDTDVVWSSNIIILVVNTSPQKIKDTYTIRYMMPLNSHSQ